MADIKSESPAGLPRNSQTAGERAEIIASAEDILKLNRRAIMLRRQAAIVRRPPSTL